MLRRRDPGAGASPARRLALVAVAAGVMLAAAALATQGATPQRPHRASHATNQGFPPSEGEPQLPHSSTAPRPPRTAALRFVRDYAGWEAGRLARLPPRVALERVITQIERAGRHSTSTTADLPASVRIAAAGADRYIVTSAVGNFLLGRQGSRWLVLSMPGD